jgi:DNA-directed RNA polymerase I and III subunit RPAC1
MLIYFIATAFYRLMPEIIIQKPIEGELAHKFQKCFPSGVIGIENKNGI